MGERESDSKFITTPAIIMDNVLYRRKQSDIKLTKSSLKKDMLEYLQCCGALCEDSTKKYKLFSLFLEWAKTFLTLDHAAIVISAHY
jgi:hypothetical protein